MPIIGKDDVINTAKGATAVAEAEDMHAKITAYIAGDSEATEALKAPTDFFKKGWDLINGDSEKSPVDILEGQPAFVERIPEQWAAGKSALESYANRSGNPIPDDIVAWLSNAEAGWNQAKKAASIQEKVDKAVELLKLARPFARMAGLPI